jgi:cobalt-zinc-cadmium efflux system protein
MSNSHVSSKVDKPSRKVFFVLCLTALYMVAEAVGGFLSNSLALLADAGHMLADVAALGVSLLAFALAARPKNLRATFGYHRAEVLGALFNGLVLLMVSFFIIKESISRFYVVANVEADLMIYVAIGGLLVNIIGLWLLHKDKSKNLNVRGAWLHVMSDTLGSIGVVVSGLLISWFGWQLADPIASIIIAALVSYSSIRLILETLHVLMEHTPTHLDPAAVKQAILQFPGAVRVHDLHIWTITSGKDALAVHVVAEKNCDYNKLLKSIEAVLSTEFGIEHTTIQIEEVCAANEEIC